MDVLGTVEVGLEGAVVRRNVVREHPQLEAGCVELVFDLVLVASEADELAIWLASLVSARLFLYGWRGDM